MKDSIFTSQFDSVMYKLVFSLMEQLLEKASKAKTGESASETKKSSGESETKNFAISSTPATGDFAGLINQAAAKYGLNPALVSAVIKAESNFNPRATSHAGAMGLMQLMPATARGLGVTDAYDPAQNIDGGVRFLSGLLRRYDGNVRMALAAYNAGPGTVDRYNGIPPYRETQVYVQRVMGYYESTNEWQG